MVHPRPLNVLFICTGNSARSIIAETLLNSLGGGRFKAFSAGSAPRGVVHPDTLDLLQRKGFDVNILRSKSWDEFASPHAPRMDFIVTVCNAAAGEQCPVWFGHPVTAHWAFEDPAAVEPDDARRRAFDRVFHEITARIRLFVALPLEEFERRPIRDEVSNLGKLPQ